VRARSSVAWASFTRSRSRFNALSCVRTFASAWLTCACTAAKPAFSASACATAASNCCREISSFATSGGIARRPSPLYRNWPAPAALSRARFEPGPGHRDRPVRRRHGGLRHAHAGARFGQPRGGVGRRNRHVALASGQRRFGLLQVGARPLHRHLIILGSSCTSTAPLPRTVILHRDVNHGPSTRAATGLTCPSICASSCLAHRVIAPGEKPAHQRQQHHHDQNRAQARGRRRLGFACRPVRQIAVWRSTASLMSLRSVFSISFQRSSVAAPAPPRTNTRNSFSAAPAARASVPSPGCKRTGWKCSCRWRRPAPAAPGPLPGCWLLRPRTGPAIAPPAFQPASARSAPVHLVQRGLQVENTTALRTRSGCAAHPARPCVVQRRIGFQNFAVDAPPSKTGMVTPIAAVNVP